MSQLKRSFVIVAALALLCWVVVHFLVGRRAAHDGAEPAAHHGSTSPAANHDEPQTPSGQRHVAQRRIAGRVTLAGKPYAHAHVSLRWPGAEPALLAKAERVTDSTGSFDFGDWPAERYTVTAIAPNLTPAIVETDLRDPTTSPPPDRLELVLSACSHRLVGTVVDGSGGPIVGASVAHEHAIGTTTAADGTYMLCASEGRQTIVFAADGYGSLELEIAIHGEVRRDIALVPAGSIVGTVSEQATGAVVAEALIAATPIDLGQVRAAPVYTHSDADGKFQLTGLGPGRFTLTGSTGKLKGSIAVVVAPAATASVALTLAARARLTGRVMFGGTPIAGARVVARSLDRWASSRPALSQLDGSFVLDEVPLGGVTFTATPYEVVAPTKLVVAATEMADVVIEVLPMASIAGTVTYNGSPAAGAVVSNTQNDQQAVCNAAGAYHLRGLSPGNYTLQAEWQDAATRGTTLVKLAKGEQRTDVDLDLRSDGVIRGTVVDQDDKPIADAIIAWTDETASDSRRTTTDASGQFRVAALRVDGAYQPSVRVSEQDKPLALIGDSLTVTLTPQHDHIDNVRVKARLERTAISGTVLDFGGSPVADAMVDLLEAPSDGTTVFHPWLRLPTVVTAEDGQFTLNGVAAGRYTVRARTATAGQSTASPVQAGAHDVVLRLPGVSSIQVSLSGFSSLPSVDAVTAAGDNQKYYATVSGTTATLAGLSPGRYLVAAHTPHELDAKLVDVVAGATSQVTLTSHGVAIVHGTIRTFIAGAPVRGMACVVYPAAGGAIGAEPIGLIGDAPISDVNGTFTLDPAPAGNIAIYCYSNAGMSAARALLELSAGQSATAQLLTLHLEPPGLGDLGVDLDQGMPVTVVGVRDSGPAAVAGIRAGDEIIALDNHAIGQMSKGGVGTWIENLVPGAHASITVKRGTTTQTFGVVAAATLLAPN